MTNIRFLRPIVYGLKLGHRACVSTPRIGLGLRMVKELDLQLALGMNERRKTGSLPVYDMHRWGVGGSNLGQTQS